LIVGLVGAGDLLPEGEIFLESGERALGVIQFQLRSPTFSRLMARSGVDIGLPGSCSTSLRAMASSSS
jgi:hypothetical protein